MILLLVVLKYPAVNYYKVVPKLVIFGMISAGLDSTCKPDCYSKALVLIGEQDLPLLDPNTNLPIQEREFFGAPWSQGDLTEIGM